MRQIRLVLLAALLFPTLAFPQQSFTIEQVLSYTFPYELDSAKKADRIAWIEFERGMRNVCKAAAPSFRRRKPKGSRQDGQTTGGSSPPVWTLMPRSISTDSRLTFCS